MAVDILKDINDTLTGGLKELGIPSDPSLLANKIVNSSKQFISQNARKVTEAIKQHNNGFSDTIDHLLDKLRKITEPVRDRVTNILNQIRDKLTQAGSETNQALHNFLEQVNKVWEIFSKNTHEFISKLKSLNTSGASFAEMDPEKKKFIMRILLYGMIIFVVAGFIYLIVSKMMKLYRQKADATLATIAEKKLQGKLSLVMRVLAKSNFLLKAYIMIKTFISAIWETFKDLVKTLFFNVLTKMSTYILLFLVIYANTMS